eukprot:CAMPEP_0172577844 /NCGR_PEP_ID=MMETSP1067-20121228/138438_1 /TAXON_ID=265564 ORGANISM="Thalassiosira punctigera, Strain Tpunct2005C2" /NCGR_SAMPLE_ID=MMETSP1067 /ASSEMBLY_ACC=CAM_ASM_000444 /LENGTH=86 /DNA_ID=CAMNT_0013370535 /DNA_START=77 /DNA_END=338 /DNA_ORIENTATION=+
MTTPIDNAKLFQRRCCNRNDCAALIALFIALLIAMIALLIAPCIALHQQMGHARLLAHATRPRRTPLCPGDSFMADHHRATAIVQL